MVFESHGIEVSKQGSVRSMPSTVPCNSQTFKGTVALLLSIRYFWNTVRLSLRSEYISLHKNIR